MNFLAILFITLKSVIYGASVFFTGYLTENVHISDILALRFLLSFIVMWILDDREQLSTFYQHRGDFKNFKDSADKYRLKGFIQKKRPFAIYEGNDCGRTF